MGYNLFSRWYSIMWCGIAVPVFCVTDIGEYYCLKLWSTHANTRHCTIVLTACVVALSVLLDIRHTFNVKYHNCRSDVFTFFFYYYQTRLSSTLQNITLICDFTKVKNKIHYVLIWEVLQQETVTCRSFRELYISTNDVMFCKFIPLKQNIKWRRITYMNTIFLMMKQCILHHCIFKEVWWAYYHYALFFN